MPMLAKPIDATSDAVTVASRRPTVLRRRRRRHPSCPIGRGGGLSPPRRSCASWPRPIAPPIPAGWAPSCVARASTPRPSATGAGFVTPEPSARWFRSKAARKPPRPTRWQPNLPLFSGRIIVWHGAWHVPKPLSMSKKSCGAAGHPAGAQRQRALTQAVVALAPSSRMTVLACAALGVSRATVQRRRANLAAPAAVLRPRARPARALCAFRWIVNTDSGRW